MKTKYLFVFLFCSLAIHLPQLSAQTDRDGANSVVKIVTEFPATDEKGRSVTGKGNGTGWCWKESRYIVTALHVVAGIPNEKITVYTDEEKRKSGAKVIRVYKEADLALLQLNTDLNLVPLDLQTVDPNSITQYSVWGFPHGIFQMGDAEIRLSRTRKGSAQEGYPTLNGLINSNDLKFFLDNKQGYPLSRVKILRISSTIQPGHSGAPIFTSSGKVIGMADGGLHEGVASLNWAIPVVEYVPKLMTSEDLIPANRSRSSELKGSITYVPEDATEEEQNRKMENEAKANTIPNGSQSISKVLTASYNDILETMTVEDKQDIRDVVNTYNLNMSDTWYDVYEDFETGATISVPYGEKFITQDGWFYVSNNDASLELLTLPYNDETYDNAKNGISLVLNEILKSNTWDEIQDSPDKLDEDAEMQTASFDAMRISSDGTNKILVYHAEVDGSGLLVVTIFMDGNKMNDQNYLKQVVHFAVAAQLATFAEN